MHVSDLNDVLWDMGQVHCGILWDWPIETLVEVSEH